jgi:hypothetical protein
VVGKILGRLTNLALGLKITNSQGSYRAFLTSIVETGILYGVDSSTKKPFQHGLEVFVTSLKKIEFNRPLYYLTVPDMSLEGLQFGPTMFMVLLFAVGSFVSLTDILLHSLAAILSDKRSI